MRKVTRNKRISIWLNDEELKALERYLDTAESRRRSEHVREILMRHIWNQLEEGYPTLFSENDMRR